MARIELPATFAPLPHALITDLAVSAAAVRLYGLLHKYGWDRREAFIEPLAVESDATERSIYRWLAELAEAGWIAYTRRPGQRGLSDRIRLFDAPHKPNGQPEPHGPTRPETSDTDVRASDTTIRASDPDVRASDLQIRGAGVLPRQEAAKHATQNPERSKKDHGGGGGRARESISTGDPPPTGQALLAAEGFSAACVRAFGHVSAELLAADIARRRAIGQGNGAIYEAWKLAPPGSLHIVSSSTEESHASPTRDRRRGRAARLSGAGGATTPPPAITRDELVAAPSILDAMPELRELGFGTHGPVNRHGRAPDGDRPLRE